MTDDSRVYAGPGGVSFEGPDAVRLFQAAVLRAGIKLMARGIPPMRGATMTLLLAAVRPYTGQAYGRTDHERAVRDLTSWIETMRSALPMEGI